MKSLRTTGLVEGDQGVVAGEVRVKRQQGEGPVVTYTVMRCSEPILQEPMEGVERQKDTDLPFRKSKDI